jgi:hypothetical protein
VRVPKYKYDKNEQSAYNEKFLIWVSHLGSKDVLLIMRLIRKANSIFLRKKKAKRGKEKQKE